MTGLDESGTGALEDVVAAIGACADQASLPEAAYTSLPFHLAEAETIFGQEWICVGHVAMLPEVGDYFAFEVIGELLVAVRGKDRVRVLSRVCLHRWASVAEGAGNTQRFTCPFHAWTYALDGRLIGAGHMGQAQGFDRSKCQLPEVRTEIPDGTGLIFINLASGEAGPLNLPQALLEAGLAGASLAGPSGQERVPANWKRVVEEAANGASDVVLVLPNLLLSVRDGIAELRLVCPDGPDSTIVRTARLDGMSGAVSSGQGVPGRLTAYIKEHFTHGP